MVTWKKKLNSRNRKSQSMKAHPPRSAFLVLELCPIFSLMRNNSEFMQAFLHTKNVPGSERTCIAFVAAETGNFTSYEFRVACGEDSSSQSSRFHDNCQVTGFEPNWSADRVA